eukprot:gene365-biopygen3871
MRGLPQSASRPQQRSLRAGAFSAMADQFLRMCSQSRELAISRAHDAYETEGHLNIGETLHMHGGPMNPYDSMPPSRVQTPCPHATDGVPCDTEGGGRGSPAAKAARSLRP